MTRRSVPRLAPADLRDHADEDRVARIWERVESDLPAIAAPPLRSPGFAYLAIAAAFAAFGGGLFLGKAAFHDRPQSAISAVASSDRSTVDVLAAGSEGRTFALPGGGQLTLQPGATVELERDGSGATLKLVQGEASIDTAGAGRVAGLVIVAGEARLNTQAGSVLNLRRNQDDMDVRVNDGSVSISSPAGVRELRRGQADLVPIHGPTAATSPSDPQLAHARTASRARRPNEARAADPLAEGAAGPEWMARLNANDTSGALTLLRQEPGGIDGAIASARSARELMAIADAARSKGGDAGAAISALKRVAERFPDDQNALIAAYQLGKMYERMGQADLAKRYFEQYQSLSPKGALAENALCSQVRAEQAAGHKDEARRVAQEYLAKYPDGQCKAEMEGVLHGDDGSPELDVAPPEGGSSGKSAPDGGPAHDGAASSAKPRAPEGPGRDGAASGSRP